MRYQIEEWITYDLRLPRNGCTFEKLQRKLTGLRCVSAFRPRPLPPHTDTDGVVEWVVQPAGGGGLRQQLLCPLFVYVVPRRNGSDLVYAQVFDNNDGKTYGCYLYILKRSKLDEVRKMMRLLLRCVTSDIVPPQRGFTYMLSDLVGGFLSDPNTNVVTLVYSMQSVKIQEFLQGWFEFLFRGEVTVRHMHQLTYAVQWQKPSGPEIIDITVKILPQSTTFTITGHVGHTMPTDDNGEESSRCSTPKIHTPAAAPPAAALLLEAMLDRMMIMTMLRNDDDGRPPY